MAEFKYEVIEKYGVVSERRMNSVEFRKVSWNGNPAKYDLRGWYEYNGEERCAKGLTFSDDEAGKLIEIINSIDFDNEKQRLFGEIPQNGKNIIKVQLTKYGYDIRQFSGNFGVKGVSLNKNDMIKLRDLMSQIIEVTPHEEVAIETVVEEKKEENPILESTEKTEDEKIIHSLTSVPVNDGNYPLKKATVDQLKKAIEIMKKDKKGSHKTRLARCEAKLKQLEKMETKAKNTVKIESPVVKEEKKTDSAESVNANTNPPKEKSKDKKVIIFPKKDTTEIVRLKPTGENHKYEEAEEKLNNERAMFDDNPEHDYVIKGLLEACVSDQEFLDNVMRPEKSYLGAFSYFAKKAKDGYSTTVNIPGGKCCVMSADTALKYAIDYFNSEEPKKPVKLETKKETKKTTKKSATKKERKNA